MGRIAQMFERREATPSKLLFEWLGPKTASGVHVTEEKALALPAVWAAVNRISSTVASLPLIVYRRTEEGKERAPQHWAYQLLHDAANPYMTAMAFRRTLQAHALLWGNGYALIEWDNTGQAKALWPLDPSITTPVWVIADGERRVVYDTVVNGRTERLMDWQVLHIPGLGFDGLRGYSVIAMEREAVGLGLAMQEMTGRVVANNAVPPIVIMRNDNPSFETQKRIVEAFRQLSSGDNIGRIGMLAEGMQIKELSMSLEDAQFIAQRNYTVLEIARIFNIPASILEAADKAPTYASAEQFNLWYIQHTVRPWLVAWEQALQLRLFVGRDKKRYFAEHNVEGLLRADTAARAQFYKDMWDRGMLTANQVAELENWNPIGPEGDERFVPLNMVPLKQALQGVPQRSLEPVYDDAYKRILRRAKADIMREVEKRARNSTLDGFAQWLEDFLDEHQEFAERALLPVCEAEGRAGEAREAAKRHAKTLREALKPLISDGKTAGNDLISGISERFSVWLDNPKEVF